MPYGLVLSGDHGIIMLGHVEPPQEATPPQAWNEGTLKRAALGTLSWRDPHTVPSSSCARDVGRH